MKKAEKLSILISIVLISLLAISAVSAADADDAIGAVSTDDAPAVADAQDTTTIAEESSSPEPVKEAETEQVAAPEPGSFSDLKTKIIDDYEGNGTNKFVLDRDYQYVTGVDDAYKNGIELRPGDRDDGSRTITIDGKGFSITGKGANTIFVVDNGMNLILENLELINTKEAAISVANATSSLKTNNVIFKDQKGTAISNMGTLIIEDTQFNNTNVAIETIGLNKGLKGSEDIPALYDVTILNSLFYDNVKECIDADNSTIFIDGSTFLYNGVWTEEPKDFAAAINAFNSAIAIVNTEFTGNNATMFLLGSYLGLENVLIEDDWSDGAIYAFLSGIDIYNTTFKYNDGGAIEAYGSIVDIDKSEFLYNGFITEEEFDHDIYDAAIVGDYSDITVKNSLFKENMGAIDIVHGGNLTVDNTTFKKNYIGAIFAAGEYEGLDDDDEPIYNIATVNIINSTFTKNTVSGDWEFEIPATGYAGGAIYIDELAALTVEDSIFNGNVGYCGGAIYNEGNLTIINSNFTANGAYLIDEEEKEIFVGVGGAIYNALTGDAYIEGTFIDNFAANGGAIFNLGDAEILGTFTENEAVDDYDYETGEDGLGGAIYNAGILDVEGDFEGNEATNGGAIFNLGDAEILGTFTENEADYGGAIANNGNATIIGTFTENEAGFGGAIYNDEEANITVLSSDFIGNLAEKGGAIFNRGTTTIDAIDEIDEETLFTINSATQFGGAIFNVKGTVYINNSRFLNDNATTTGAEIYTLHQDGDSDGHKVSVVIDNTVITNNIVDEADILYCDGCIDLDKKSSAIYTQIVDFDYVILNTVEDQVVIFFTLYDVETGKPLYADLILSGDIEDVAQTGLPYITDELEGDIGGEEYLILATLPSKKGKYEGDELLIPINVTLTVENLEELLEIDEAYEDYLEEKIDNLTDENNNLTEKLNATEKELNATKDKLNTTEKDLKTTTEKLTVAVEGLYLANSELNATKGKLNTTEAQLKQANDDLTKEIQQNTDLSAALANKNTEAANLQAQVATLQTQNKQLNSDVKAANDKAATANNNANAKIKKVKAASKVKKSKNFTITVNLNKKVKGKYVFVAFNGKTYKKKTNSKGVAKITIKKSALKKLGGKKVKYQIISGNSMKNKSVKIKK